jgi:hypothetical protein
MPGRKRSRLPCGKTRSGRSDLGDEQTQRLEHKEMSATSKTNTAGKSHSRIKHGKPTHSVLGKAADIEEETGKSTRWDRRGRGPGIWGKICRDRVGKNPLAAGAGSNLQRLSD